MRTRRVVANAAPFEARRWRRSREAIPRSKAESPPALRRWYPSAWRAKLRRMAALLSLARQDAADDVRPLVSRYRLSRVVRVTAAGSGRVVCTHCEVADRTLTRMRGLLGRRSL